MQVDRSGPLPQSSAKKWMDRGRPRAKRCSRSDSTKEPWLSLPREYLHCMPSRLRHRDQPGDQRHGHMQEPPEATTAYGGGEPFTIESVDERSDAKLARTDAASSSGAGPTMPTRSTSQPSTRAASASRARGAGELPPPVPLRSGAHKDGPRNSAPIFFAISRAKRPSIEYRAAEERL
jgi:hypothetical protein